MKTKSKVTKSPSSRSTRGKTAAQRKASSDKRERQYEKIKESELGRGRTVRVAERIAAATTNKTRRQKGETKQQNW